MKLNILSLFVSSTFLMLLVSSCDQKPSLYKREFTENEKKRLPEKMVNNLIKKYNQGTVSEILVLEEGLKQQPNNALLWREIGVPYLKRGYAAEFHKYYAKAVENDPINWQGWRGYVYLYFYRDYQRAITDFDQLDALTPNFIDHPQATSVHYMRGICYLQLGKYEEAHSYWNQHIEAEVNSVGEDYISSLTFLFQGITYFKQGNFVEAKKYFDRGLKIDSTSADLFYWQAKLALEQNDRAEAKSAIEKAELNFKKGKFNERAYVEEFYQTYLLDIEEFQEKLNFLKQ